MQERPDPVAPNPTAMVNPNQASLDETVRVPPGDYVVQVRDETQAITVVAGEAQVVEL